MVFCLWDTRNWHDRVYMVLNKTSFSNQIEKFDGYTIIFSLLILSSTCHDFLVKTMSCNFETVYPSSMSDDRCKCKKKKIEIEVEYTPSPITCKLWGSMREQIQLNYRQHLALILMCRINKWNLGFRNLEDPWVEHLVQLVFTPFLG